jgi:hypothetical protein
VTSEDTLTIPLYEATDEQIQKALASARRSKQRCEKQGSLLHAWDLRIALLEASMRGRRRSGV